MTSAALIGIGLAPERPIAPNGEALIQLDASFAHGFKTHPDPTHCRDRNLPRRPARVVHYL